MSVRAFAPAGAEPLQAGITLELDDEESRYLVKVRRVRVGEAIELFDAGAVWLARLVTHGRRVRVEIDGPRPLGATPLARVLLLGLPDAPATLESITGACELGATQVVLVRCERSAGHVPSAGRLERVMRAAMRQCGRPSPPELLGGPPAEPWSLPDALAHQPELPGVFGEPHANDKTLPPGLTERPGGMRLLVGPEGGLSAREVEAATAAGFVATQLGPWVLRTPTAAVALLARFGSWPQTH
ncbi:RsmE family RNA methyltransferase [Enhygromyxa salina]|uniref:Ribosomal RNA small subunit methyltransferase E n=1 Tax=Enhygromyxa salina TaxID=215803 RepID=A0A2S9YQP1_9BACT|nr:RsmE family RNA methyltransferase [Enhygromyxa salina]PRQ07411.1 Ribosomal RNA small subunit methyltransferase E [Enhygromyxa salina]